MSIKHLALLSLGAVAMPAAAQDCPEELEGDCLTLSVDELTDLLGPPRAIERTDDGGELHVWVDDESGSLVLTVDADGEVVDVEFTDSWMDANGVVYVGSAGGGLVIVVIEP